MHIANVTLIVGNIMLWFKNYVLEDLEPYLHTKTLVQLLDINIIEIGNDYIKATMPVDQRTHQLYGLLHGGATCVLVETIGSFGSLMCIDIERQYAVGSQINVNHLRAIREGLVIATCRPVHIGRQKHVWDVSVNAQDSDKLIAKGELTCAILNQSLQIGS